MKEEMNHVPKEIDGARVICYATRSETLDFGIVSQEDGRDVAITALVIAQYEGKNDFYVFACDENWQVLGDTVHESQEKSTAFAKRYYEAEYIDWQTD